MRWTVNPAAVATLVTGRTLPDRGTRAVAQLLRHAFGEDLDTVLYGDGRKPSLLEVLRRARAGAGTRRTLTALVRRPETRRLVARLRPDVHDVRHALPFLVPVIDAGLMAATDTDQRFPVMIGRYRDVVALQADGVSWRDPLQGCLGDCYLIAAMSALAWSRPLRWRDRLAQAVRDGAATGQLRFNLYRNSVSQYPPFDMPGRVPVGLDDQPVYATAPNPDESWPALVERAFVMQRCKLRGIDPSERHYDRIGSDEDLACEPEVAARMLLGGRPRRIHKLDPEDKLSVEVGALCDRDVPRFPMIACTKRTGTPTTAAERRRWRDAGLLPDHAYTVLGIMDRRGSRYIVLRNPFGGLVSPRESHARGTWQPQGGPANDSTVHLRKDGVVAIPAAHFDRLFTKIGWLELPPDLPADA